MNLTEQFISKIVQLPNYIDFPILIIAILSAISLALVTISQDEKKTKTKSILKAILSIIIIACPITLWLFGTYYVKKPFYDIFKVTKTGTMLLIEQKETQRQTIVTIKEESDDYYVVEYGRTYTIPKEK
jgi:hypothetical protein